MLDESQRRDLASWMPAITRHNESTRLFAWLEEDMLLQTGNLSALETRIAVARSYVCSQRAEFEGLVSGWHYRLAPWRQVPWSCSKLSRREQS